MLFCFASSETVVISAPLLTPSSCDIILTGAVSLTSWTYIRGILFIWSGELLHFLSIALFSSFISGIVPVATFIICLPERTRPDTSDFASLSTGAAVSFAGVVMRGVSVRLSSVLSARACVSGFAVEGKTVNGFVKDGGVTLNVQSPKAWQSTVGHEITHVLEGTEAYGALREALYAYAESKGELASRKTALTETYNGMNADIDAELTADLVGDYLFTDKDFINKLTGNRTLFQKVWDEVKYLCKVATGKELTEIEKVDREFARAWKEQGQIAQSEESGDVKYSISKTSKIPYGEQLSQIEKGQMNGSNSLYVGKPSEQLRSVGFSDAPFAMNQSDYRKSRRTSANNKHYSSHAVPYDFFEKMPKYLSDAPLLIDNGEKVSIVTSYGMNDTRGNASYVIAGVWNNQPMESDTVNQVKSVYPLDDFAERIKKAAEAGKLVITNKNKAEQMLSTIGIQPSEVSRIVSLAKDSISQLPENVNTQFSLSKDNNGNQDPTDNPDIRYSVSNSPLDNGTDLVYNENDLYTSSDSFIHDVSIGDRNTFSRSLANKTADLAKDEIRTVEIYGANKIYFFKATGYMQGQMLKSVSASNYNGYIKARKEYENGINRSSETPNTWVNTLSAYRKGARSDISDIGIRRGKNDVDGIYGRASERNSTGTQERSRENFRDDPKEVERIVSELRKQYGFTENHSTKENETSSTDGVFFDGENTDVRYSLSNEGEQFAPTGNYSTPLNEAALSNLPSIKNKNTIPNGMAFLLAEKERFELSRRLIPTYTLSRGASSAS